MQFLFQLLIIFLISFIGEILNWLIPLPIPGSVYGMIILLASLLTGIIKLKWVEKAGDFLISILPFLCVPPIVGLLDHLMSIRDYIIPILLVCIISTVIVMVLTGLVSQAIRKAQKKYPGDIPAGEAAKDE